MILQVIPLLDNRSNSDDVVLPLAAGASIGGCDDDESDQNMPPSNSNMTRRHAIKRQGSPLTITCLCAYALGLVYSVSAKPFLYSSPEPFRVAVTPRSSLPLLLMMNIPTMRGVVFDELGDDDDYYDEGDEDDTRPTTPSHSPKYDHSIIDLPPDLKEQYQSEKSLSSRRQQSTLHEWYV
jgi:hypothetical protein